jgi:hypothetical protein
VESPNSSDKSFKEKSRNHLTSLEKRYENIATDVVERLVDEGELEGGDYTVKVDCIVTDRESNETRDIKEILQQPSI